MPTTDGRHARSHRTRATVAEAMLDCFEEGLLRPSAKEVAQRAGVSTRAVFRHFENMEALLEEAAELQTERVIRQLPPVVTEGTLAERIDALILRTARLHELVAPVRRAALLSEPFSEVIRERHTWMRSVVRRQVRSVFSRELEMLPAAERRNRIAAFRALLAFSYWDELRRHERLSVEAACRVLRDTLHTLLGN
ncbi:MAG: TetR family transcriptional regulator [bacterium]|nr:TetR family transcriptional regulator [bacterium]